MNACDVNEQSGLYAAVVANKIETVRFLLDFKVRRLTETDCERIRMRRTNSAAISSVSAISASKSVPVNLASANQISQGQGQSPSFFEQLKSVFLDTKSYDPYVVNYTSNPVEDGTDDISENVVEEKAVLPQPQPQQSGDETDLEEGGEYFNPFNVDLYSKFGSTCLHEAIRMRNFNMVELLLNKGRADPNLSILESISSAAQQQQSTPKPVSNCVCEALKLRVSLFIYSAYIHCRICTLQSSYIKNDVFYIMIDFFSPMMTKKCSN